MLPAAPGPHWPPSLLLCLVAPSRTAPQPPCRALTHTMQDPPCWSPPAPAHPTAARSGSSCRRQQPQCWACHCCAYCCCCQALGPAPLPPTWQPAVMLVPRQGHTCRPHITAVHNADLPLTAQMLALLSANQHLQRHWHCSSRTRQHGRVHPCNTSCLVNDVMQRRFVLLLFNQWQCQSSSSSSSGCNSLKC